MLSTQTVEFARADLQQKLPEVIATLTPATRSSIEGITEAGARANVTKVWDDLESFLKVDAVEDGAISAKVGHASYADLGEFLDKFQPQVEVVRQARNQTLHGNPPDLPTLQKAAEIGSVLEMYLQERVFGIEPSETPLLSHTGWSPGASFGVPPEDATDARRT
jgi:hypothetical protein